MGIRGLTALINLYAPNSVSIHHFRYFKGSKIAIDTSILLYKFRYSSNSNPNAHINGFMKKCLVYIKNGIIPIFILDGKPPPEKNKILQKRTKHKQKIESKIKDIEDNITNENQKESIHKIKKLNKQLINVTKEHHKESKELLQSLGFIVISSPGEAEAICAFLQKKGDVNYTYSDDTDALVLGCKKVLRSNTKINTFMEIDLDSVLEELGINFSEFTDLCILCGCDYCPSIPRLGYCEAYELIKKYSTIENIINHIKKEKNYNIPVNFPYNKARDIFNDNIKLNINNSYENIPSIDRERLTQFLLKKKFKKRYINNYIHKFNNNLKSYKTIHKVESTGSMKDYFDVE